MGLIKLSTKQSNIVNKYLLEMQMNHMNARNNNYTPCLKNLDPYDFVGVTSPKQTGQA